MNFSSRKLTSLCQFLPEATLGISVDRLSSYLLIFLCLLFETSFCHAHQSLREQVTAEQLAEVQPPLQGSENFAQELITHLRNRLDAQQMQLLDEVDSRLLQTRQIRTGRVEGTKVTEAEYHRWQAEVGLVKLLSSLPDVIELDFRRGRPEHDADDPIELDPQYNLAVLRVITGDGPTAFRTRTWDLVAENPQGAFTVEVNNGGTTYVMLKLQQLPKDRTTSHLGFLKTGDAEPTLWHALTIDSKPWGHLAIEVKDEQSKTCPVLMQIASHEGHRLWEPPGAVDLRAQLNDIVPHLSHLGRGYVFFLPGKNRGRYWIIPKPLEMVLPEGKWDVTILHGPEYLPIRETLTIEEDQWTRKSYQLRRWIDMPSKGWYSGDDHVHARLLSSEDAENLLTYSRAVDVHVSNILEMGDTMRTYYAQRGYGPEFRVQHEGHWLIPGQEDPRSELGHAIGLNLTAMARDLDHYLLNDWVAQEIHDQGGLYGHTHMGADACFVHREMAIFTPMEIVDFNSIMQAGLGTDLYYQMLNLGFKMTASAGADTPYGGTIGAVRVYAYLGDERPFSPDGWFDALRKGNTFVTNGPMIDLTVDEALPGEEIVVSEEREFRVVAKVRGIPGASAPKHVKLVYLGETIHEVTTQDKEEDSITFELEVPVEFGGWLAIHAVGHDGSEAHTTPVYVKRDGYRHWNIALAPQLIERQLDVLEETEAALSKSEDIFATGVNPLDYWNRINAEQADQVRDRLTAARKTYELLRETVNSEQTSRGKPN